VLHDFVVLTFDYASYGESEGSPRNDENVQGKPHRPQSWCFVLQTLPFVGEIGVLGACTTGGKCPLLAADDDRSLRCCGRSWMYEPHCRANPGKEGNRPNDAKARYARERFAKTVNISPRRSSPNTPDIEGFMLGAAEYFFDKTRGISFETGNEIFGCMG